MQKLGIDDLTAVWDYSRSRPRPPDVLRRVMYRALGRSRAPKSCTIREFSTGNRWIVYFIFAPSGELSDSHRFTLARLRREEAKLAVVCATLEYGKVPAGIMEYADAVQWKALGGFDFSAYAIALEKIAQASPGAQVLCLNDSVLGPFGSMDMIWNTPRWDMTGFTASSRVENHIQSYAFLLGNVTPQLVMRLKTVMSLERACRDYNSVVWLQETRLARVASESMSVGAHWYCNHSEMPDATIFAARALHEAGFLFVKKALFAKHEHRVPGQDLVYLADSMAGYGHPLVRRLRQ